MIAETFRTVRDLVTFAFHQRSLVVLVAIALVLAIAVLAFTITTVAPVVIYPFV